MKVKILEISSAEMVDATIEERKLSLPGLHDGWRFAFDKQIAKLSYATAYVIVTEQTQETIEGCMIFQMKNKIIPYMSFVEVAPHNKTNAKRYDYVAGCLIAFAFRQSIIQGKGDYKAWLTFDVMEEKEDDQIKLMGMYSLIYGAVRVDETQMYIMDDAGDALIKKYLARTI
jgi:hypothetical protein